MDSNLPAITDQPTVPAVAEPAAARLAVPPAASPEPAERSRQNITTGLFPMALAVLILVFLALGVWTLMATTGGGLEGL